LAFRSLRKRPLFCLVSILSLTIGTGATTAIFSAVNQLQLRPLRGIPNASRMVEIGTGRSRADFDGFSYLDFLDLREQATVLDEVAGYKYQMLTLSRGRAGERASAPSSPRKTGTPTRIRWRW
jgi:hypothetical protein